MDLAEDGNTIGDVLDYLEDNNISFPRVDDEHVPVNKSSFNVTTTTVNTYQKTLRLYGDRSRNHLNVVYSCTIPLTKEEYEKVRESARTLTSCKITKRNHVVLPLDFNTLMRKRQLKFMRQKKKSARSVVNKDSI